MLTPILIFLGIWLSGKALNYFLQARSDSDSAAENEKRWRVAYYLVFAAAIICGLMFIIAASGSVYVFNNTPDISELPVFIHGELHRTENKIAFFGFLSFAQFWHFLAPTITIVRWERFRKRAEAPQRKFGIVPFTGDIHRLHLIVLTVWTSSATILFYYALSYYSRCLHGDCALRF